MPITYNPPKPATLTQLGYVAYAITPRTPQKAPHP